MMMNTIFIRRANKLVVDPGQGGGRISRAYLATALKNIEQLGYTFSHALMHAVRTLSREQFEAMYGQLVSDLKVMVGAHVKYEPMYPDFPLQVMQEEDVDLYLNAIYHYLTLELPEQKAADRPPLPDRANLNLKVIDLGTEAEFRILIGRLIEAKGSISETDKNDIDAAIEACDPDELHEILPSEIPFKENVGFVVGSLLKHGKASMALIERYFNTATDVLRLAAAWSGGDVSLAEAVRFRKFKRPERRLLLGLLEQCYPITEDMLRYRGRWIRLGEILHPSEYGQRYKRCEEAFDILRNRKPFTTFNSSVELAFKYNNTWVLMDLLAQRPGEFARRLDQLLRSTEDAEYATGFAEGISLKADYSFGTSFVHALIMGFIFFVIGSQIGSVRNQGSGESHSYGTVIHRAIFSSIVGILVCVILFHSYLLLNGDLDDFKRDDVVASTQVSGYLWSLSQLNSISFTIGQPELMDYKLSLLSGLTSQSVDDSNININDIISKLRLLILVPILLHLMSGIAFRRASTTSLIKRVTGYAISFGLLQTLLVYMQNLRFYTDIGDMITADISISLFEAFVIGTLFSFIFAYAGVYIYNYFSSKQNRSY